MSDNISNENKNKDHSDKVLVWILFIGHNVYAIYTLSNLKRHSFFDNLAGVGFIAVIWIVLAGMVFSKK